MGAEMKSITSELAIINYKHDKATQSAQPTRAEQSRATERT